MSLRLVGEFRGSLIALLAAEDLATFVRWADKAARRCSGLTLPAEPLAWPEDWGTPSIEHYQIDDYRDSSGGPKLHVTIHLIGPTHIPREALPDCLAKVALTGLSAKYRVAPERPKGETVDLFADLVGDVMSNPPPTKPSLAGER